MAWKISASTTEDKIYLVRFLNDLGPIKFPLSPARYTNSTGAIRGSWCLHVTSPVRVLGGSNVTQTNLEARPWLVDVQAAIDPR